MDQVKRISSILESLIEQNKTIGEELARHDGLFGTLRDVVEAQQEMFEQLKEQVETHLNSLLDKIKALEERVDKLEKK